MCVCVCAPKQSALEEVVELADVVEITPMTSLSGEAAGEKKWLSPNVCPLLLFFVGRGSRRRERGR